MPNNQRSCRTRPCKHTFVADSFEKRKDLRRVRKFSDEFFHIIRHDPRRFFVNEL